MKKAFLRDENKICSFVGGNYKIGNPGVEGMNTLFDILEVDDVIYGHGLKIYFKDTYAYAMNRPEDYEATLCIYYLNYAKENYCRRGNFLSFDIFKKEDGLYYIPSNTNGANPFDNVLKQCPINMSDVIKVLNIDKETIFNVPKVLTFTSNSPCGVSEKINFVYKGYKYYGTVEDIKDVSLTEKDDKKVFRVTYKIRYGRFRDKIS